jgi:hypothetical protein
MKNILFVCILGGYLGASAALPEQKKITRTDSDFGLKTETVDVSTHLSSMNDTKCCDCFALGCFKIIFTGQLLRSLGYQK